MQRHPYRTFAGLAALILASLFQATISASGASARETRCESLLDAARGSLRESSAPSDTALGLTRYAEAFAACSDPRTLPLDLGARVALEKGRVLHHYENDAQRAIGVYEEALRWTAERGGLNHPSRIALIEGLAEAVYSEGARRNDREALEQARRRTLELYEQALSVRQAAYGEASLEAAKGLLLLATARLDEQPVVAEELAKRALEIAVERRGEVSAEAWVALGTLRQVLLRQGRSDEAALLDERSSGIRHQLIERGEPLGSHEETWFVTPSP